MAAAPRAVDMAAAPRAVDLAAAPRAVDMAAAPSGAAALKVALLAEIRNSKKVFYNTVVAQAQRIEVAPGRVTFSFSPAQRTLRDMFEQNRAWLETMAQRMAGRRVIVASVQTEGPAAGAGGAAGAGEPAADRKAALREQAMADSAVQALLQVFPAEIRDVEEM